MSKGFGQPKESNNSNEQNKSRILQKLEEDRDIILAFYWKNYTKYGLGAVILRAVNNGEEMSYRPNDKIHDFKDLKVVEQNDPNTSAVVFAYFGQGEYFVTTLIGPKTPPECYEILPDSPQN